MRREVLLAAWWCWCCMARGTRLTPPVRVAQGWLRGLRAPLLAQHHYYGIPYAVAKRFQTPQKPASWKGELRTVNRLGSCAQTLGPLMLGREDCLHLDVYTPNATASERPVMMFVHGGAYYHGSKWHYGAQLLVRHDVVVVVVNYRLGALGFLCVGDVANLGLKDQVAALRWIRENISAFGGDPENVTLFGQSAGASAVGMHMFSESSKGLFHRAILQSGTPLAPWALNPEPLTPSYEDAQKLGANPNNAQEILQAFKKASLADLMASTMDTSIDSKYFKYSPCVANPSSPGEPFLTDTPYNILASGLYNKVPAIIGFTELEGALFYGLHDRETVQEMDKNFLKKLPAVFDRCSERDRKQISSELRSEYFGSGALNLSTSEGIVRYYSDWVVYSSAADFSKLLAASSQKPVYSYVFSYEGDRNFAKFYFGRNVKAKGATHSDDVFYLFQPLGAPLPISDSDRLFVDRITTMWTNFAKFGDPTPAATQLLPVRWPRLPSASSEGITALRLDRRLSVTTLDERFTAPLWRRLLCDYGRSGYVPCHSQQLCKTIP